MGIAILSFEITVWLFYTNLVDYSHFLLYLRPFPLVCDKWNILFFYPNVLVSVRNRSFLENTSSNVNACCHRYRCRTYVRMYILYMYNEYRGGDRQQVYYSMYIRVAVLNERIRFWVENGCTFRVPSVILLR